jgi:predicted pyridoxine 5'-phosphate oxidase superfamily flavin-nucleotide-binding protein
MLLPYSAELYKVMRRHFEKKKQDQRLAMFTTMDNKAIAKADEKRRVKRGGEKAV